MRRLLLVCCLVIAMVAALMPAATANPHRKHREPRKDPVAIGRGGAVSTVDPTATAAGIKVLRRGGNAVDAAVAVAATLGVTEPYSAGIGGGGFMLVYLAESDEVVVIDGREEAPDDHRFDLDVFAEFADGGFFDAVNSGLSVGVPGTLATWVDALERYGTISLRQALRPGIRAARRGFIVDETFASQTEGNLERFRQITSTADTFLVDGEVPEVGSRFRNRDLARTYRQLARRGPEWFYGGELGEEVVETVQDPPTVANPAEEWQPGFMDIFDLADYEVQNLEPTQMEYQGYDVFGMPSPSSGGITVGETLNIIEDGTWSDPTGFYHLFLESTAHAFADRNAYIGDDRYVYVPQEAMLSEEFAAERFAQIDPNAASDKPVAPGNPCDEDGSTFCVPDPAAVDAAEGANTTHLVTADRYGNMVSYTLTIEQTGGSAITVPDRGFLLNNELTDFNFTGPSPNLPAPGKRPRSSMSPTIVLDDGEPFLAVGTPGGSTIITTVAQVLANRLGRDVPLPDAVEEPRATQRNTTDVVAEPAFIEQYGDGLTELGHTFEERDELGAVTAIERRRRGFLAVAEAVRRGGGDAGVVRPRHRHRR
ncbi:MAG: gamma-glutamyltransferase [Actinobacteria bacterium]|nr:gamma-glutamyltransferase [Actinomycetota bacterium]